jgi:hypothetical protein
MMGGAQLYFWFLRHSADIGAVPETSQVEPSIDAELVRLGLAAPTAYSWDLS